MLTDLRESDFSGKGELFLVLGPPAIHNLRILNFLQGGLPVGKELVSATMVRRCL